MKTNSLEKNPQGQSHLALTDWEFSRQFETCTLAPILFSHEAHLRLTWINITAHGLVEAEKRIQKQLQDFVSFVGEKEKYNATLTIAAIKMVYHFIQKSGTSNFTTFISEFPQLKNNFKRLIERHYSFDIFNSKRAKSIYLEPDLLPFN